MARKKVDQEELDQARETLLELLPVGKTVHTLFQGKNAEGSAWWYRMFVISNDTLLSTLISYRAGLILGLKTDPCKGVRIEGGGMNMAFDLVYRLSRELHGDGYALKLREL